MVIMIDIRELDSLRHTEYNSDSVVMEMLDTIEALWKVAEAAKTMDDILCFSDRIYDVREREVKGWEGPLVTLYRKSLEDFQQTLTALKAKEEK